MKGIIYEDSRLMPGSKAHELHTNGDLDKLKKHMEQLQREAVARGEFVLVSKQKVN